MSKPVILTGLRANNSLHIGNYFGALLPLIDMAKSRAGEYQINLFVPDLHSFTTPIDHTKLYKQTMDTLKIFIAAGLPLDNDGVHIYRQSFIPAHSELTVILNSFTGFGEMSRMTQFKSKSRDLLLLENGDRLLTEDGFPMELESSGSKGKNISVGLFDYPVLMAADILLYGAAYVPVGDDQSQHLEFTRDIAQRMNAKFGELFTVPEAVKKQHEFFGKDQGLRIKNLQDPAKKMSKSDDSGKGIIFLSDSPEEAAKKVLSATTDSMSEINLDFEKQPGISNLLQIQALLSGETPDAVAKHRSGETNYAELKKEVANQVKEFLQEFQDKLARVDEEQLKAKLEESEKTMNGQANHTLLKVQKAVGLRA